MIDLRASWETRAACATPQVDPNWFFPDKGGSSRRAKAVCSSCSVAVQCLNAALRREERFGVWGGLSERERRRLLRIANVPEDVEDVA